MPSGRHLPEPRASGRMRRAVEENLLKRRFACDVLRRGSASCFADPPRPGTIFGYIDARLFVDGKGLQSAEDESRPVVDLASGKKTWRVAHARRPDLDALLRNMPAPPSAELPFGGLKESGYASEVSRRRWRCTSTRVR